MKTHYYGVLVPLFAVVFHAPGRSQERAIEPWSVMHLVTFHQSLKDSLQVQDVYKLLYQANFGPEHLVTDSSAAVRYLLEELSSMDTAGRRGEELIERISSTGEMVRINLRPWSRLSLSPDLLVHCMMESLRRTVPDTLMFYRQWNEFSGLVRYGLLDFPLEDLRVWDERVQRGDITAVHHSTAYGRANAPAYRVARDEVARTSLPAVRP